MPTLYMASHKRKVGILPTQEQELLLRATLLEDPEAWNQWNTRINIQQLDPGTERLLPLLQPKLDSFDIAGSLRSKIEEIYSQTRMKNRIMLMDLSHLITSFRQAEIDTMILKGAALIPAYYHDPGLRPMVDLDVAVPSHQALHAIEVLRTLGYEPAVEKNVSFSERLVPLIHGYAFTKRSSSKVDLHWHILQECLREKDDNDFWDNSHSLAIETNRSRLLSPADQILHLCVHGCRWAGPYSIRWIADVMMILNSGSEIDWSRLTKQTNQRRLMAPVHFALTYLRETFHAPVTMDVLEALAIPSGREFTEFQYKMEDHHRKTLGNLPLLWYSYLRSSNARGTIARLHGFTGFLQHFWGLQSRWLIPFGFLKRLSRKLSQ